TGGARWALGRRASTPSCAGTVIPASPRIRRGTGDAPSRPGRGNAVLQPRSHAGGMAVLVGAAIPPSSGIPTGRAEASAAAARPQPPLLHPVRANLNSRPPLRKRAGKLRSGPRFLSPGQLQNRPVQCGDPAEAGSRQTAGAAVTGLRGQSTGHGDGSVNHGGAGLSGGGGKCHHLPLTSPACPHR